MKSILITGSHGFVGTYFRRKFSGEHSIRTIDIKDPKRPEDARDYFKNSDIQFDIAIHLAAVVGGRETIERNPLKVAVDLAIDAEMVQWALRTKPKHLVYFSSSAAYPTRLQKLADRRPLAESDIDLDNIESPDMTYGFSKLAGEYQAKFLQAEGVRTHIFRPFSGYGTDQDLCYPFPSYIDRAKNNDGVVEIWGTGEVCRDFIHIEDVVDAVMAAIDEDVQGPINLGTGRATSFNELAVMASRASGRGMPEFKHLLDKPIGVEYRVADPAKMLSFYQPRISLEEGIERALV